MFCHKGLAVNDLQIIFNIAVALSGALGGWILKTIWDAIKSLDADVKALGQRMHHEFVRRDCSLDAWEAGHRPEGMVCFWRTVVPAADQKRRLLVDDDTLMELFDRLEGDDRAQRMAYRWLMCLILLRKKLLRQVRVERDGTAERWLVQKRGVDDTVPPIAVVNPMLRDEDLQELAEHLGEVMQSEL